MIAIQRDDDSGSTVPVSVRVAEGLLPEIAAAIQSDSITVAQAASS